MDTEHISEYIQTELEESKKNLAKSSKIIDAKDETIRELQEQIEQMKSQKVHFSANEFYADIEKRLIKNEYRINEIYDRMFTNSVQNPEQKVLSPEGKRLLKQIKERRLR